MKSANPQIYYAALTKYFARMSPEQKQLRPDINTYMSRAIYREPRSCHIAIKLPFIVYIVYTSGVEYDFPHTLDNIIIIPVKYLSAPNEDYYRMIAHEMVHIYFHNCSTKIADKFCIRENIVVITREHMPREIVNPDTLYHTALKYGDHYIFIALIDAGHTYVKKYYTVDNLNNKSIILDKIINITHLNDNKGKITNIIKSENIRPSTAVERNYYDSQLPYEQNEHPEEIIATIISTNIKFKK